MRSAQVYRWQIPMDAGVVLRDRRLKTRDGLYVCLREGAGLQSGNLGRGAKRAACLGK